MDSPNATFIPKLFAMTNDPSIPQILWSKNGKFFIIPNPEEFAQVVLPIQFSHNNFASFVRQLNMYGFHKVADLSQLTDSGHARSWAFEHAGFVKGRPDLLHTIRRKPKISQKKMAAAAAAAAAAPRKEAAAAAPPLAPPAPALSEEQKKKAQLLIEELYKTKEQQKLIARQYAEITREREKLWKEYSMTQQRLFEQQQVTNQVLNFLAVVYQQNPHLGKLLKSKEGQLQELPEAEIEELESDFSTVPNMSSPPPSSPLSSEMECPSSPASLPSSPLNLVSFMDLDDSPILSSCDPSSDLDFGSILHSQSSGSDDFLNHVLKFEDSNLAPFCSMEEDRLDFGNSLSYWVPS